MAATSSGLAPQTTSAEGSGAAWGPSLNVSRPRRNHTVALATWSCR